MESAAALASKLVSPDPCDITTTKASIENLRRHKFIHLLESSTEFPQHVSAVMKEAESAVGADPILFALVEEVANKDYFFVACHSEAYSPWTVSYEKSNFQDVVMQDLYDAIALEIKIRNYDPAKVYFIDKDFKRIKFESKLLEQDRSAVAAAFPVQVKSDLIGVGTDSVPTSKSKGKPTGRVSARRPPVQRDPLMSDGFSSADIEQAIAQSLSGQSQAAESDAPSALAAKSDESKSKQLGGDGERESAAWLAADFPLESDYADDYPSDSFASAFAFGLSKVAVAEPTEKKSKPSAEEPTPAAAAPASQSLSLNVNRRA